MNSVFPVICSESVAKTRDFYVALLGLKVVFEIEWYVQLQSATHPSIQIGIVARGHDSVPEPFRHAANGVLVTVELDDADAVHARAQDLGLEIVYPLKSEVWGQRHFMVADPNGLAVDVVQLIPPSPEFLREYGLA